MESFSHRKFNTVELIDGVVVKTGQPQKITAEVLWYNSMRPEIKKYCPKIFSWEDDSYRMEYIPDPTLSSWWVNSDDEQTEDFWSNRVRDVLKVVHELYAVKRLFYAHDGLLLDKSFERVKTLSCEEHNKAMELIKWLENSSANKIFTSVVHGDLCFSNMMWGQSRGLSIIDPRGLDSYGNATIYGNILYDIAKLFHSIDGGYDFIVHGVEPNEEQAKRIERTSSYFLYELEPFMDRLGFTPRDLLACTGLLFYSMLPLHEEDENRVNRLKAVGNSYYGRFKEFHY